MSHHRPPWKAYAVSQYWQRSGQPVRRTNTVGQPTLRDSPCSDRKISVSRRRSAAGLSVTCTSMETSGPRRGSAARRKLAQPRLGLGGGVGAREARHHFAQAGLAVGGPVQGDLAVGELEQGIGFLARAGVLRQQGLESLQAQL